MPVRVVRRYGWAHSFPLERQPAGARGEPGGDVARALSGDAARRAVHGAPRAKASTMQARGEAAAPRGARLPQAEHRDRPRRRDRRATAGAASGAPAPASSGVRRRTSSSSAARPSSARISTRATQAAAAQSALGTDSRITGSRDLLDELRAAAASGIAAAELLRMVTEAPAAILKLADAGRIAAGRAADLLVLPPRDLTAADALVAASRRDVALVTMGGRPVLGSPWLSAVFVARRITAQPVSVDGAERLVSCRLARAIARCPIAEPGVECLS